MAMVAVRGRWAAAAVLLFAAGANSAPPAAATTASAPAVAFLASAPSPAPAAAGAMAVPCAIAATAGGGLPPEALMVRSWSNLKGSMDKIGDQVKEIMLVRKDVAMLQEDLKTQEDLWHKGEFDLTQENANLKDIVASLRDEVEKGSGVKSELDQLHQSLKDEAHNKDSLQWQADQDRKHRAIELDFLTSRKKNVTEFVRELNLTATAEIHRAQEAQLLLETDAAGLRLKLKELQDRVSNLIEDRQLQRQKFDAEMSEYRRQLVDMAAGLERIRIELQKFSSAADLEKEIQELQAKLKAETQVVLQLQQDLQRLVTQCEQEQAGRRQTALAEQRDADRRHNEMEAFCRPVRGQKLVLEQMLAQCAGSVGARVLAPA